MLYGQIRRPRPHMSALRIAASGWWTSVVSRLVSRRHRRPVGGLSTRQAGITALAVFAVTAGLTVLLAALFRLAWPSILVAIIGTVPALYLAWLAVPGVAAASEAISPNASAFGLRASQWNPVGLGVHKVIGGGPMPAYIRRPLDDLLAATVDPTVTQGRLVVVRGGSSVGKTRAALQAVLDRLGDRTLDYPLDPDAVAERLDSGIPPGMVLWLGELRQYADADRGPAVLARLADLFHGEGPIVITTIWPEDWSTYTDAARSSAGTANPIGTIGRLLQSLPELSGCDPAQIDPARGGVVDVPDCFTAAELRAAATSGDTVLAGAAAAASAAGHHGQVTQYLAGVPDLLGRYNKPGGDPYGQAVIAAAMDATRLGHRSPLPAALFPDAAIGYLTDSQRTKDVTAWHDTALAWATAELNGAVRALRPVPPDNPSATGVAGYKVADYLEQHARRTCQDHLVPASLWESLAAHSATDKDLSRLGQSAWDLGLYRYASELWTSAVARGSYAATVALIEHLRRVNPEEMPAAAAWAASRTSLDDPRAVASMLAYLSESGASGSARTLADRAAADVRLADLGGVRTLLARLHHLHQDDAVRVLANRSAMHVRVDELLPVVLLLRTLQITHADNALGVLASRVAADAPIDHPARVSELLKGLRQADRNDAVHELAVRAAAETDISDREAVGSLLEELRTACEDDAIQLMIARDPVRLTIRHDPAAAARLLREMDATDRNDAAGVLAEEANAEDPRIVVGLLETLRWAGYPQAVSSLAARAATEARVNDAQAITHLLKELRAAGERGAFSTLAARAATHTGTQSLDILWLFDELRTAGESEARRTLAARAAAEAPLDFTDFVTRLLERMSGIGEAMSVLASRAATGANVESASEVAGLLDGLRREGLTEAASQLAIRAAGHTCIGGEDVEDLESAADLLHQLHQSHAPEAVRVLCHRIADEASVAAAWAVGQVLPMLTSEATHVMASRAALDTPVDDPHDACFLLRELHEADERGAVRALATRIAYETSADDFREVSDLVSELRRVGADDAANTLVRRTADTGRIDLFQRMLPPGEAEGRHFGQDPDGRPADPWKWQDPSI
jgi:hypothetical protein